MRTLDLPGTDDRLLSITQVAERLGLGVRTLWKLHASRKLPPGVKIGKSLRWRLSDIAEYIARGCEWPDDR